MNETSQENKKSENKEKSEATVQNSKDLGWYVYAGIGIAAVAAVLSIFIMIDIYTTKTPSILPELSLTELPELSLTDLLVQQPNDGFFIPPLKQPNDGFFIFSSLKWETDVTMSKILEQEMIIQDIQNKLDLITKLDTTTDVGAQIALTRSDTAALNSRVQILEDGILENPEKALAIPLLRKDIENIGLLYAAMAHNIDRLYDQNKWFIRLMFTVSIGFIGLVVSNFVQMRKKQ